MTHVTKEVLTLAPGEYCIRDYNLDNYYLIVGEKKACLIDTGSGIGNPLVEVREITDKEVMVLLTHGHLDHAGNAHHFDEVYMHEADHDLALEHFGEVDLIKWYIETRGPVRYPDGDLEALINMVPEEMPERFSYHAVEEGDVFDLGGVSLEAIATPGHTPGSMSYLSSKQGFSMQAMR